MKKFSTYLILLFIAFLVVNILYLKFKYELRAMGNSIMFFLLIFAVFAVLALILYLKFKKKKD